MPNVNDMLKNVNTQTIGAVIAVILTIVGLAVGITANNGDGSSNEITSSQQQKLSQEQQKSYQTEILEAARAQLTQQGWTLDKKTDELAWTYWKSDQRDELRAIAEKHGGRVSEQVLTAGSYKEQAVKWAHQQGTTKGHVVGLFATVNENGRGEIIGVFPDA